MEYKYANQTFSIVWNNSGQFECTEFGIIKDTPEEVKAEIRLKAEKVKILPIVDVFFFDYGNLVYGKTNLKSAMTVSWRNTEVWVSWKNTSGGNERRKIKDDNVYFATPENIAKINQVKKLLEQASCLQEEASGIKELLLSVVAIEI